MTDIATMTGATIENVELTIADDDYEVVELHGHEKVSELFRFDLVCRSAAQKALPRDLIGKAAVITLNDGFGLSRAVHGLVASARRQVREDDSAELCVEVRPVAYRHRLGRDSRVFNDMTVPEIADSIVAGVTHRWEISDSYRTRVYTAQYREDDWTFLSRLLEEEGIHYWFDHSDGTTLVFGDDSRGAPVLTGGALLEYQVERGMLGDKEHIEQLGSEAHATATKFTVGSFDPFNPMLKVTATQGDGIHEHYDAPGAGPETPALCEKQALVRMEAAQSFRAGLSGEATSVRIVPGMTMEIGGHASLDGRYFVTECVYDVVQRRRFADGTQSYHCHFEAIDSARRHRALEDTPVVKQAGLQSGRVVGAGGDEIHTDDRGRVRVQMHWDRQGEWDDKAGRWLRVAQRGTASSMLLPRVGWNVLTFMEEGNVDLPNVLSRVHDAEHPPPYPLPANKTRTVFRTATSPGDGTFNEIRYEDISGAQEMFINATKDMNYIIQDLNGDQVGRNQTRIIGNNQTMKVGTVYQESITNDQDWKVSGDEKLEVEGDRTKGIGGDETDEIGGNRNVEVGSNFAATIEESRELEVGGALQEKTEGNMTFLSAATKVDIGGSVMRTSQGIINSEAGAKQVQKIGGAKLEICGQDRPLEVSQNYSEVIGGSLFMKAGAEFMDGSDSITRWEVTSAMTGVAPHVHIEAKDKIELVCGGSSITIDKQSVTIMSPSYDLSASPQFIAVTKRITHN